MTNEEVIKILEILHQRMDYPTKEALAIAIDYLSQPSLPSDLDEAAEEYSLDVKAKPYENLVKEAFKGGSKWRDAQIAKLPDNVDEAAEKSMPEEEGFLEIDIYGGSIAVYSREQMLAMFKAGVEFMAEQGVSYEDTISSDKTIPVLPMKDVSDKVLDYGDKVIVQIRKK